MSNLCTNVAVISSTDKKELEAVLKDIKNTFECYTAIELENNSCEFEFGSSGSFPKEVFMAIIGKYPNNGLYIQIVTYQLPNEYVAHHVYQHGVWTDKLKENNS